MKDLINLILFISYLILIFYINNFVMLFCLLILNISIMLIFKLNIFDFLKQLLVLTPFLFITGLINFFTSNLEYGLFILIRLIVAYSLTFTFIKMVTISEIANALEKLLFPLKIFRIDVSKFSLIISIGISVLPSLLDEFNQKLDCLKAKGFKINIFNMIVIFRPLLISILLRTNEFEDALISKGFEE